MFLNRNEAANLLALRLTQYKNCNGVILAVPRGGVPLGCVLSEKLNLPLDLVMTKKIGHPAHPEYAIGSVSLHGITLGKHATGISEKYIAAEAKKLRKQMTDRLQLYNGKRKQIDLKGKTVILVDDGVATGSTLMAAIEIVRKHQPGKIVVAVPVSPYDTAQTLTAAADEFVCLSIPEIFYGVGEFYADFKQVDDEEVIALLRQAEKKQANK